MSAIFINLIHKLIFNTCYGGQISLSSRDSRYLQVFQERVNQIKDIFNIYTKYFIHYKMYIFLVNIVHINFLFIHIFNLEFIFK